MWCCLLDKILGFEYAVTTIIISICYAASLLLLLLLLIGVTGKPRFVLGVLAAETFMLAIVLILLNAWIAIAGLSFAALLVAFIVLVREYRRIASRAA